ncbi:MAG: iron-sulfur cluster assembly accessory protein [Nannocystaceae bacterium]|nr:iron-sulfur cluster assembly accessory protein [Nannocystaceae bacterium]
MDTPEPQVEAPPPKADIAADTIVVTARAAKVMRGQLEKRGTPEGAIRFGIRGGGCTGYSYMFQFEDGDPRGSDTVVEADGGVRVYVDPKSMRLIKGTKIDFETGLRGHGFRFDNPNTSTSCGCGESISF